MPDAAGDIQKQKEHDSNVQVLLMIEVVRRILKKRAGIELSRHPVFAAKPIIEFMKRLRASSLDKFEGTTYIAAVHFYLKPEDVEKHKSVGAVVLYINEEYIVELFQKMGYPVSDEDDHASLEDACGTLCNLIAGNFKAGLTQLGFEEMIMSPFSAYRNEAVDGVPYHPGEKQKYQIEFEVGGKKRIVIELTMGPVPRLFNPK